MAALLLFNLCFDACGGSAVSDHNPELTGTVSLSPQAWYIDCGQGMPPHPDASDNGAWVVRFPNSPGSIQYVKSPYRATVRPHVIRLTFRVNASIDALFNGRAYPDAWDPATFHLFLQRRGDDLRKEFYRWWSRDGGYVLSSRDSSVITIEVALSPENWASVNGNQDAEEFNATLDDMGYVGITFGGSNYFASGVNMLSGSATFTLIDFQVQ